FLWAIFVVGIVHGRGWLTRVIEWKPLRYLGLISLSAYLWHGKFISDFDDLPVPSPLRLIVFLIVVVAIASVSYFVLERPLMRVRPRRDERLGR
ncbi:MAG TPA: hypothetical protein VFG14_03380, partial [Chthoniobacteraceae bacterium]|nr:hypothetical protein [Chthoniobacteraceae bacterium]